MRRQQKKADTSLMCGISQTVWLQGGNREKLERLMKRHPELANYSQAINWVLENWIGSWELVKKGGGR